MRAVVFEGVGSVGTAEVPDPRIEEPGDALVDLTLSAICGSDLHCYHGKIELEPGDVMGHEAVGVVRETGPEVAGFAPGDRVVIAFSNVCGRCWYCLRGQTSLCERFRNLGFGKFSKGLGGLQAQAARVAGADVNLLRIPDLVDDEQAVFCGDVLTTALYGTSLGAIEPGEAVAVVGAGPVGFLVARCAQLMGAGLVAVLDRVEDRLEMAERHGAVPVNVDRADPKQVVKDLTDGRGADVGIEAVGNVAAFTTAVAATRRGGRVVAVGVAGDETLQMNMAAYWYRGLRVSFSGICPVHAWWGRAMDAVASRNIDPTPLISHRLPLHQAPEGYSVFDRREATKVVLLP